MKPNMSQDGRLRLSVRVEFRVGRYDALMAIADRLRFKVTASQSPCENSMRF